MLGQISPRGLEELLYLRQLRGDSPGLGVTDWITLILLITILYITLHLREKVAVAGLFRLGVLFFALSIAVPPFATPYQAWYFGMANRPSYSQSFAQPLGVGGGITPMLLTNVGPVCQALTVLCLFNAMLPRVFGKPKPAVPEKHPLDD